VDSFAEHLSWRFQTEAVLLLGLTLGLLFLPKILALLDLRSRPAEVAAFGGWTRLIGGILLETVLFTLLAPVLMLFHTKFIGLTLLRRSVGWKTQRRGRDGESDWRESVATHMGHTALGVIWLALAWWISPMLAAWMSPILAGFILSIPVSFFTGCAAPGLALKRAHLLQTPEESDPPVELIRLNERLGSRDRGAAAVPAEDAGLLEAVTDPYVNAIHLSQLRAKDDPVPANEVRFAVLRERLLREGPGALAARDKLALMLDADSMSRLHRALWAAPAPELAAGWRRALERHSADAMTH
jgi:membrane glycosyltransferase